MAARVILYTRSGCHLCETAKEQLALARRSFPFELQEVDIDSDPALRSLYNDEVPVISIDGRKAMKLYVEERELVKKLRGRS